MSGATPTRTPAPAWLRPATLADALAARAAHPDWLVVAGGTDVMVGSTRRPEPPGVLDLFGLAELSAITEGPDGLCVGAGATYAALLRHPTVRDRFPCLHEAAREVGALQIQARGTLGGNVQTSSPVGDTLPPLLALDAEVEVASAARGPRRVPYAAWITSYRKTALATDELLVAVHLPWPAPGTRQRWRKVGTRKAQAISKVMLAATARLEGDGPGRPGTIAHARVALGAVADRPVRLPTVEALLVGASPDPALAERVREAVRAAITPITDVRSTADYRREVAANLVARFVLDLAAPALPGADPGAGGAP